MGGGCACGVAILSASGIVQSSVVALTVDNSAEV